MSDVFAVCGDTSRKTSNGASPWLKSGRHNVRRPATPGSALDPEGELATVWLCESKFSVVDELNASNFWARASALAPNASLMAVGSLRTETISLF